MAIIKDDNNTNDEPQDDQSPQQEEDLIDTRHVTGFASSNAPDFPFTPLQKAFIMSLFRIDASKEANNEQLPHCPK